MPRRVMSFNNRRGILSNTGDDLVGLESALSEHLGESSVRVMGCVAMFSGTPDEALRDACPGAIRVVRWS